MNKTLLSLLFVLVFVAACSSQQPAAPAEEQPAAYEEPAAPSVAADVDVAASAGLAPATSEMTDLGPRKGETTSRRELAAETGTTVIEIRSWMYDPKVVRVAVGTTVTWINEDHVAHTVTSESFDSGSLAANGGEFSYTFSEAGTYEVHSTPFRTVKGTVIVE